jgi:hypothetical protein
MGEVTAGRSMQHAASSEYAHLQDSWGLFYANTAQIASFNALWQYLLHKSYPRMSMLGREAL